MKYDFGTKIEELEENGRKIQLSCKYIAPNLTLHDLMVIFNAARANTKPGDQFSGDPGKWPDVKGVRAVAEALTEAFMSQTP